MAFTGIGKLIKNLVTGTPADTDYFAFGNTDLKKVSFPDLKKALGIDALNSAFTRVYEEYSLTSSAEYKYSGIFFTIPEGHVWIINIESVWEEVKPSGLIISTSKDNYDNSNILYKKEFYPPIIDIISTQRTLHIFCRHEENSKKGKVRIRGLLVKVPI